MIVSTIKTKILTVSQGFSHGLTRILNREFTREKKIAGGGEGVLPYSCICTFCPELAACIHVPSDIAVDMGE